MSFEVISAAVKYIEFYDLNLNLWPIKTTSI